MSDQSGEKEWQYYRDHPEEKEMVELHAESVDLFHVIQQFLQKSLPEEFASKKANGTDFTTQQHVCYRLNRMAEIAWRVCEVETAQPWLGGPTADEVRSRMKVLLGCLDHPAYKVEREWLANFCRRIEPPPLDRSSAN